MKLQSPRAYFEQRFIHDAVTWWDYFAALVLAGFASAVVYGLERLTVESFSNISGFLILAVLVSAVLLGTGPAVLTAIVCSFLFDWLVVPPFFGATNSGDNIIKFSVFVIAALMTSWIAGMAKRFAIELKKRERELLAVITEKERYKREKDQEAAKREGETLRNAILFSLSHDLKTPLASIIGAISSYKLYRQSLSDTDKQHLINSVLSEANRLHGYLDNILEVAKLESQPMPIKREHLAVDDVIDLTIKRLSHTLRRHHVKIDEEAESPVFVGDERLMDIALGNILDNAAKFSNPGSTICIAVKCDAARREVCIDIHDEGASVSEHDKELVFDKFYRARQSDKKNTGTGLGLWIARHIVRAHGGDLSLSRRQRHPGTTVRIRLPLAGMADAAPTDSREKA
jgi:two-component system sensor histidine kinase KdpD